MKLAWTLGTDEQLEGSEIRQTVADIRLGADSQAGRNVYQRIWPRIKNRICPESGTIDIRAIPKHVQYEITFNEVDVRFN